MQLTLALCLASALSQREAPQVPITGEGGNTATELNFTPQASVFYFSHLLGGTEAM